MAYTRNVSTLHVIVCAIVLSVELIKQLPLFIALRYLYQPSEQPFPSCCDDGLSTHRLLLRLQLSSVTLSPY